MKKSKHPISEHFDFTALFPSRFGYIIWSRAFMDWPLLHDAEAYQLFSVLMMSANFKTKNWGTITIHRGELVTSYAHLGQTLHKSRDQIKNTLAKIKRVGDVHTRRIENATLVKLPNFNLYQSLDKYDADGFALPMPDLAPTSALASPTTKEREECNPVIMQEKKEEERSIATFRQSSTNNDLAGLSSIFARQKIGVKRKYDFKQLPPDWDDVVAYAEERKLNVNLDSFYHYYENHGWCEQNGKKLGGWHFALWHTHKSGEYL